MKCIAFLFIISALSLCFSNQSNSSTESCSFDYCYSNNQPTLVAKMQPNCDRGVFWQSKDGYCQAGMSAHRRTKTPTPSHATVYVQQNYSKLKNFRHSKEWHAFFTELTNIPPKNWTEGERKDLFYKFELYQHWTYKYFLQSFPEFEERIVELDKLSRQDKNFREKLNNHYMTYKWWGFKGNKSVADYVREQLPRARKYLQDRQIQKEREEQNRIYQQKIKLQEPVRELFLDQADEIDIYKLELVENPHKSIDESFCSRNQKRVAAIQEAINNNFRISIKQYELSGQAASLLKQYNVDSELFKECVGNTIQQEIHQEFIDVLHNGAKLYCEKTGLPGVAHFVSEDWFGMLGDMSMVGAHVNVLGRYSLAHTLSDICQGIYSVGKKAAYAQFEFAQHECVSIESIWNASVDYVKWALKNAGDTVVDFTEGVQQKAFVRPAQVIAEFAYVLQNDPEVVFEKATNILIGTAQYVLETTQLLEALTTAPFSEQTQQLLDSFEHEWAGPFRERVATAARIFWEVPLKEKAQEAVAIGLQVFAAVGAAKLLAALPAQAALLKTSALLKLDQLSQISGPVTQTGVAPDGTMSAVIPVVEQMSEELVAAVEEVITIATGANAGIATTAVADAVSIVALAVRDGATSSVGGSVLPTPPQIPDDELAKKIAKNVEAIQKMKERGIEVSPEYERLALEGRQLLKGGRAVDAGITHPYMTDQEAEELRTLFIKEMGGEETLKKLGLEGATIDKCFIKHVVSPEIKTMVTRAGRVSKKLSGCHLLDQELLRNGTLKYETLSGGFVKKVQIYCDGISDKKTVFPIGWTKERTIAEIGKSIKQLVNLFADKTTKSLGELKTSVGPIDVVTVIDENKRFTTSFPALKEI